MKAGKKEILFFATLSLIFNCTKKPLEPREYMKWVTDPNNGLHRSKTVGDYTFDLQYKPIPLLVANELQTNFIPRHSYEAKYSQLNGSQYYTLSIFARNGAEDIMKFGLNDRQDYFDRVRYFSFDMQYDLYLIEESVELPCILYHFERTYGVIQNATFVLAFEQRAGKDNVTKTFVLDSEYFNTGPIKIRIKNDNLALVPQIKLYE